jgi:cysteinyl-tRNA synthetase
MTNNFKHRKMLAEVKLMAGDDYFYEELENNRIELYNSLTKKREWLRPIHDNEVRIYSCGPTVYNNLHIGNLMAFVISDVLVRTLKAAGYKVKYVMNITDIDDKTIRDSKLAEFKDETDPMVSLKNLTAKYEGVFMDDMKMIGNDLDSITFIWATDTIGEMIKLTQDLIDKDLAYVANDGVYFSISEYVKEGHKYGILQHIDLNQTRSRIDNDEYEKDSASDFALWKLRQDGEPYWNAEFIVPGEAGVKSIPGRPGWHIECSVMSEKLLDLPFDIHTGGIDLKFPHHENEIAQSCGARGIDKMSNFFIHNNHLLVDGKKMSKSLNNFYTLRDLEERGVDFQAFRLLLLSAKYSSEINFTWEILEAAQNRLRNWQAMADLRWQLPEDGYPHSAESHTQIILDALSNDLDTPAALNAFELELGYLKHDFGHGQADLRFDEFTKFLEYMKNITGIDLIKPDISEEQKKLLDQRQEARDNKDFSESDRIRDELKEQGVEVRDDASGQIWSRV